MHRFFIYIYKCCFLFTKFNFYNEMINGSDKFKMMPYILTGVSTNPCEEVPHVYLSLLQEFRYVSKWPSPQWQTKISLSLLSSAICAKLKIKADFGGYALRDSQASAPKAILAKHLPASKCEYAMVTQDHLTNRGCIAKGPQCSLQGLRCGKYCFR